MNIRKEGTSASCGLEGGCAVRDAATRSLTAARPAAPAAPVREGGRACGGIEIRVGYAAAAAAGISGDAAASCGLPGGSRALILSDGMGKGIKAAAGSRLVVTRLRRNLKAGMPVAKAIKEVNRYMIEQAEAAARRQNGTEFAAVSTQSAGTSAGTELANPLASDPNSGTELENPLASDPNSGTELAAAPREAASGEDFATVDLTVIDRQSRRAKFYKMGAATSFIMRQGRVRRIKGAALPVGIIPKLRLAHISAELKEGDLIVMASDGITESDREDPEACWLCEYLSQTVYRADRDMEQLSARQIAADILAEAEKRYGGRERDDLTVAAAIIVKTLP